MIRLIVDSNSTSENENKNDIIIVIHIINNSNNTDNSNNDGDNRIAHKARWASTASLHSAYTNTDIIISSNRINNDIIDINDNIN